MAESSRRLRGLVYNLADLESALRTGRKTSAADSLGSIAKRFGALSPQEFLEESRQALEEVLLGDRDLPVELIGLGLDAIANVDEMLRELGHG